ncbi:MAG: LacI family DNA-binding transcriptional regulator [Oscillospiraceae bacterium]
MTIADVAKKAGVSVATVSRVLNGEQNVRPDTLARVRQAISELNYTPNASARNLRRRESRVILVLARSFTNPFYSHVLSGISDTARPSGYSVLMCDNGGDPQRAQQQMQMLKNHEVDGAILLNCTLDDHWLQAYAGKYPMVQCCECLPGLDTPRVSLDHFGMAYDAVRYLISMGHRRIAIMSADNRHPSTAQRYEGYCKAMSEAGLPVDDALRVRADGDYSFKSGHACAVRLLSQRERPTAIFCISDVLALSVLLTASEMGIHVPGALSVVGCDDVDYTTMWHPFLTTMRLPCYDMGRRGAQLLLQAIRSLPERGEEIRLPYTMQIRESSGPLKPL